MTDTGRVPGEGQPDDAGAPPEQQPETAAAGSGAYTFTEQHGGAGASAGEEEDLLMPGVQGAWSEVQGAGPAQSAHETGGRDSGEIDLGAHRAAHAGAGATGAVGAHERPSQEQAGVPRRPLHLGPPVPEQSGAVRTLADRGPGAPAPGPSAARYPAAPAPQVQAPEPQHTPAGPEYLDTAHMGTESLPGPQLGGIPAHQDAWTAQAPVTSAAEPAGGDSHGSAGGPLPGPDLAAVPPAPDPAPPGPVAVNGPPDDPGAATTPAPATESPDAATGAGTPVPRAGVPAPETATDASDVNAASEAGTSPAAADTDAARETTSPETTGQPAAAPGDHGHAGPLEPVPSPGPEGPPAAQAEEQPAGGDDGGANEASTAAAPEDGAHSPASPVPAAAVALAPPQPQTGAPVAETPPEQSPQAPTVPGPRKHEPPAEQSGPETPVSEEDTLTGVPPAAGDVPDEAGAADPAAADPAAADPAAAAPGFDEAEREAVHRLMRERRDIRNGFRPDAIPHEVLLRVLEAAHTAPSVGHSQPWDFVVIRSEETRRTMHELAQRQREAYAESLPKARAKQFKELKVEAILDTPVNIVVTADPTRGGRHTLGRHSQPQMAPYSSALAVENLWLAARAEGLGVGWVSFFDEREMVRTLDLPEHLEVVAYLCIGYVDEFPAEPELMQAGWSKRRPLSWVVHEESYGRRALPGAEPHDLLAETLERIRPLDAKALGEAWERQKRMTKPPGALGMLEIISAQLCGLSRQCPPPVPEPAAVAVFAGDHGVHAQGVTPWPQEVTGQMVANFLGGGAVCNAFANQVGAEVCVIDVGVAGELPATPGLLPRKVRAGTADMTQSPALTREEVLRAVEVGVETARDLVAAGNKALLTGEMGIANTTASAALIAACTGADPAEVTGRGTGINDETHTRKVDVVRRALQLHQPDPADPVGLLAAVGGLEHAALTGLILGGASLRTPVILDGVSAGAAALVARQIAPEALAACIAGHRSAEPGHVAALTKLGLRPLIELDLRLGEGTGSLLALPMVQSAARVMHEVATFDSAGVTEKA